MATLKPMALEMLQTELSKKPRTMARLLMFVDYRSYGDDIRFT